jgi:hypothetical protein
MPINARQKGVRGENEVQKLLGRVNGVTVKKQPSSGAFGTRIGSRGLTGDLVISYRDIRLLTEVKRRKAIPKVLEEMRAGLDVLLIRGDQGEWMVCLPVSTFTQLLGDAAEIVTGSHG